MVSVGKLEGAASRFVCIFAKAKIMVSLRRAVASNSPPDCCIYIIQIWRSAKNNLTGTDNYAKVTIAREGGDYTYEIPQSEWTSFNAAMNQIPVKVFAKEMTDEVIALHSKSLLFAFLESQTLSEESAFSFRKASFTGKENINPVCFRKMAQKMETNHMR